MAATHQQRAFSSGSRYDVFLSFHGGDVRRSFADHLYHALVGAGIRTFRDEEELEKGKEIAPDLHTAIQQSIISIPIFSVNYGSSKWCLNELNEIYECKITGKQTVFPIFYKVEPRDVRHLFGSYARAFEKKNWQNALQDIGSLDGWHFKEETYEGKYLREVVKEVLSTLNKRPKLVSDELVGIESHKNKMLELLDIEGKVTKIVGICGLGGIGKTTIARAVCNEVLSRFEFDQHAFVENVREDAGNGICYLQNKLITAILKDKSPKIVDVDDGIKVIQQTLHQKRVLVVLDDVDQDEQVKSLIGDGEWFGVGTKIIITSRKENVLIARKAQEIYKPDLMGLDESLELFSYYAFKRSQPQEDYLDISKEIVKTARGLPLALKIVGSSLFEQKKPFWESKLKMLQKVPDDDVMKRLKISYIDLKDMEQEVFLDIACFFIGMKKDIVCHMWERCDLYPQVSLEGLRAKSLITINEDGELRMHDVLRDLGRHIVHQENEKPGKRSRIWFEDEVLNVLFKQKGKIKCSRLAIDFKKSNIDSKSKSRSGCSMNSRLDAMTELRLLQLDHAQISDNCINSFSELRWLSWKGCPERNALTNFYQENLVVLDLSESEITEKWMGWKDIKMAVNLKVLKLESCKQLRNIPDLSENQLLEVLSFKNCEELVGIETSICSLTKLVTLDLSNCKTLKGLPTKIGFLTSLDTLHLPTLGEFPIGICELASLKTLKLSWLRSPAICFDFGRMASLTKLELASGRSPRDLGPGRYSYYNSPNKQFSLVDISSLPPSLTSISISWWVGLRSIPSLPSSLTSIKISSCESLQSIPNLPLGLTSVELYDCPGLPRTLSLPSSLTTLSVADCNSLVELSASGSGSGLGNLKKLRVSECRSLKEIEGVGTLESLEECIIELCYSLKLLPKLRCSKNLRRLPLRRLDELSHFEGEGMDSLEELDIRSCNSLKKIPYLGDSKGLRKLYIKDCEKLTEIEGHASLQELTIIRCISLTTPSDDISTMKNLRELEIRECDKLSEIPGLYGLEALQILKIDRCQSLSKLDSVDGLEALCSLRIIGCCSLERLPDLFNLKKLSMLEISKCEKLTGIPGLHGLESLGKLEITKCHNLSEVHGLNRLKSLRILDISNLTELRVLQFEECQKSLEYLFIKECNNLSEIHGVETLKSLRCLKVEGCKNLPKVSRT